MSSPVLAPVLLRDREGDVWRVVGLTADGVELLACEDPQDPENVGPDGPTYFAWTRPTVERWFGPLERYEAPRVVVPSSLVLGREQVAA
jgi:hypothetical protein